MTNRALEMLRAQVLADAETPEPVRRALEGGAALESIHLDARGRWWHEGESFVNEKLAMLFSRSLFQTERGLWFLRIGGQSYPVTVADTGAFAERLRASGPAIRLRLSTGEEAEAAGGSWLTDGSERLGVRLLDGRDVRLVGAAHQEALSRVELRGERWGILLPSGWFAFEAWPEVARGLRLPVGEGQG